MMSQESANFWNLEIWKSHWHFRSGGFIGEGVFSHNFRNREAYEEIFLLKEGILLVAIKIRNEK